MVFPDNLKVKYLPTIEQKNRFDLLRKIIIIFEERHIKYFVVGGYGLDGLYGELTRDHDDIDMIIDSDNLNGAQTILSELGFKREADKPSGLEVYLHDKTNTKLEMANLKLIKEMFRIDEERLTSQTTDTYLSGLFLRVINLEGQKLIRAIQDKRFGQQIGLKIIHDEMIIKKLEQRK